MIAKLLACTPPRQHRPVEPDTVVAPARGDHEDRMLELAEASAARRVALQVRYYTASRGEESDRALSVQRIEIGPHVRLIAHCHKSGVLKTFRADCIRRAVLDPGIPFVRCDPEEVDAYLAQSVDGFHGEAREPVLCRFVVRDPKARWVAANLLPPMNGVRTDAGLEVTVKTAAVEQVARFVVGLGGSAVTLTPELTAGVRLLAEGALAACDRAG
jgi:predicted DNA-binding transcriptional regulator YafY